MLNSKGPSAAAAAEQQYSQIAKVSQNGGQNGSETGSELGNTSDHSSAYSSRSAKALQALPNGPNGMRYASPSSFRHSMTMLASGYPTPNLGLENGYANGQHQDGPMNPTDQYNASGRNGSGGSESVKAFACTTCSKGFARRSDLARHGKH